MTKDELLRMDVMVDVDRERERQNQKWGVQRHNINVWLGILSEEFGEVAQAINRINFPNDAKETDADDLYKELIQVAAVAVAIAEQMKEEQQ